MTIILDHTTPVRDLSDEDIRYTLFTLIAGFKVQGLHLPPRARVEALFKQYATRRLHHEVIDLFLMAGVMLKETLKEGESLRVKVLQDQRGCLAWEILTPLAAERKTAQGSSLPADPSHEDLQTLSMHESMSEVATLAASVAAALHTDNTPAITAVLLEALPRIDMFALWSLADSLRVKGSQS